MGNSNTSGYNYYILSKGTELYKGFGHYEKHFDKEAEKHQVEKPTWFAEHKEIAFRYAHVIEEQQNIETLASAVVKYIVKRDLRLLNLNSVHNIKILYKEAEKIGIVPELKKAVWVENGQVMRNSVYSTDEFLSGIMCGLGFDGYMAKNIVNFHDELMLCTPKNSVEVEDVIRKYEGLLNAMRDYQAFMWMARERGVPPSAETNVKFPLKRKYKVPEHIAKKYKLKDEYYFIRTPNPPETRKNVETGVEELHYLYRQIDTFSEEDKNYAHNKELDENVTMLKDLLEKKVIDTNEYKVMVETINKKRKL